MLEESCNTMDKKNNRQLSTAAQKQGNGNDSKRLQNNGEHLCTFLSGFYPFYFSVLHRIRMKYFFLTNGR